MESIGARLARAAASGPAMVHQTCEEIAAELVTAGLEPPLRIPTADFTTDRALLCADRYWRRRLLREPSVEVAARAARWLVDHADSEIRPSIIETWALGYAFITRDTVDSREDLVHASGRIIETYRGSAEVCFFATLYHAGKLRANFWFAELEEFLESSLLAVASGRYREEPLFTALSAFAALGNHKRNDAEHGLALLDTAWDTTPRTRAVADICVHALDAAKPFPDQASRLRAYAETAVAQFPDDHLFWYRLACGRRRCGDLGDARAAIDTALRLLPATGTRVSHTHLQERYLLERTSIDSLRAPTERAARQQRAYTEAATPEQADIQTIIQQQLRELMHVVVPAGVASVVVMTALAVTTNLIVTAHDSWSLGDRLAAEAILLAALLLASVLIIAGARRRLRSAGHTDHL